jgi:hypothetical protein
MFDDDQHPRWVQERDRRDIRCLLLGTFDLRLGTFDTTGWSGIFLLPTRDGMFTRVGYVSPLNTGLSTPQEYLPVEIFRASQKQRVIILRYCSASRITSITCKRYSALLLKSGTGSGEVDIPVEREGD